MEEQSDRLVEDLTPKSSELEGSAESITELNEGSVKPRSTKRNSVLKRQQNVENSSFSDQNRQDSVNVDSENCVSNSNGDENGSFSDLNPSVNLDSENVQNGDCVVDDLRSKSVFYTDLENSDSIEKVTLRHNDQTSDEDDVLDSTDNNPSAENSEPSSSNVKKSKYSSINSIFSSSLITDYFHNNSNSLNRRWNFHQKSNSMVGTDSTTSPLEVESEDTLTKLPKINKLKIPSARGLTSGKLSKLSPKNCYRLVILGPSNVGKTSLVSRFLNNKFSEDYSPTQEDFHRKLYRIRGDVYQLDILDMSGNHPFLATRKLALLTGDLFLLVFSIDSADSFDAVMRLRTEIIETKQRKKDLMPRVPIVIAGNKCDLNRRCVPSSSVLSLVSSMTCCSYVETSAKKNAHVDDLFYQLFSLANLPMEMCPTKHKKVQPEQLGPNSLSASKGVPALASYRSVRSDTTFYTKETLSDATEHVEENEEQVYTRSPHPLTLRPMDKSKSSLSIRRRLSEAYGVVAPDARRPSIGTDLLLLRSKTPKRDASCVLQ